MSVPNRSVLVSFSGVGPSAVDIPHLAHDLGLAVVPVCDGDPDISNAIAQHASSEGKLIVGTGYTDFDARAAAAIGVPLVLLSDAEGAGSDLAVAAATGHGATVVGPFTAADITASTLGEQLTTVGDVEPVMSQALFEHWLKSKAQAQQRHIVLPEGDDDRILTAAADLLADGVCQLTILGNPETITARAKELGLDLSGATLDDPAKSEHLESFAQDFYELRKAKGVTLEQARETMLDISYFATMMIYKGLADGMVSGAAHTTAHTIKPSFQIIKTKPGVNVVSSLFLMVLPGKVWGFGDCAVNPNPTAEQLAEIAVVSAETAAQFGIDPKVALLSYSTGTSGHGPDVDRCAAAVAAAKELASDVTVDGPLQFDAAVDPGVAAKKAPDSPVAGEANVMIFPDLEAGNICYKAVQRTSGALAIGPILQGLKKPVNDLSRGATVADIINTVAITAIQAQGE